eukprot:TRINITY_DN4857_c0_g1_i1.p1 TRINITY_DN4857_c0_g1~~TRINITY_DN4857_c0_g1_i1.p1  ORF type:complete len:460 (-),score=132.28 TRINITY_DN4857_c0_g1_i1:1147-2526(-)
MAPEEIVAELDKHIVGQKDAKRAVAVAIRNRWRRRRLPKQLADEVIPRNILMIGPTGVGKTEVARRVAKLANSPFIKVEATKFTEVGFRGMDVDQIIKDLVEISLTQTKKREREKLRSKVEQQVEDRLLDLILFGQQSGRSDSPSKSNMSAVGATADAGVPGVNYKESFRQLLRQGGLDDATVEYDLPPPETGKGQQGILGSVGDLDEQATGGMPFTVLTLKPPSQKRRTNIKLKDLRPIILDEEIDKLLPKEELTKKAVEAVEQDGIVFFDEIDKICGSKSSWHPDASGEGVQRDLLPIIEGTTIHTRLGNINTGKILWIASGAFHQNAPSDLLAELQGRLPIRVQLKGLSEDDLARILTEPENNLVRQETALLEADNINVKFEQTAVREIARFAHELNQTIENIGARRLQTVVQRVTEDISFNSHQYQGQTVVIDAAFVKKQLEPLKQQTDLKKFIW